MDIIVYPPGAGGNLVSAVIDNRYYYYDGIHFHTFRKKLRTLDDTETMTDEERDSYILEMSSKYLSVPSHIIDYHINRKHDFILIAPVTDVEINWCINRFIKIHPILKNLVENSEDGYKVFVENGKQHTDKIITVEEIYSGKLIDRLKEYVTTPLNEQLYHTWLESEINKKP
jgi:hypothetical protein